MDAQLSIPALSPSHWALSLPGVLAKALEGLEAHAEDDHLTEAIGDLGEFLAYNTHGNITKYEAEYLGYTNAK